MKTTSVWVVTLAGEHVHHGHSVQGVIETIDDLRIIRGKIKETYGIEFESENSAHDDFRSVYRKHINITDDRDIMLILERVSMYQNDNIKNSPALLRVVSKHFKKVFWNNDINSVCQVGYFLTPIINPGRLEDGFVEDFKSLPKCVLIDGIGFQISNQAIELRRGSYRTFCAEYYRIDYKGKIKNHDGTWAEDGVVRPDVPVILDRKNLVK